MFRIFVNSLLNSLDYIMRTFVIYKSLSRLATLKELDLWNIITINEESYIVMNSVTIVLIILGL